MNIEVVETDEGTISGGPELLVVVQSDEILDLPRLLGYIDERYSSLWEQWDRRRPIFNADCWDRFLATRAEGYRFHEEWIFQGRN